MPVLPDISAGALNNDNPQKQLESLVRQLNEWGRLISNESITRIIRSDLSTEAIKIGSLGDDGFGIGFSDGDTTFLTITKDGLVMNDGTNDRILIGKDEGGF